MVVVRYHFDRMLRQLNEQVLVLGRLTHESVDRSVKALVEADADAAREVVALDTEINRTRFQIENQCYYLIATEQPVAGDLRAIVSALIVAMELERIADHGKKVARTYLRMVEDPTPASMDLLVHLSDAALALLDRALRAFAIRDGTEAEAVCLADDEVDAIYKQLYNATIAQMQENPRLISKGTHLIQVGHELERVADRATNIAERVIYIVTGELRELNV